MDKFEQRLEQAARAAWLSYVGGRTQDDIAVQLGVSRPGVQRLLSLARQERLVKISIDHPVASSMALSDTLVEHFGLSFCDVVPSDTQSPESIAEYLAVAGAERLAFYLGRQQPQTISLSTGRAVRAAVEALSRSERPQHRIVSLVGNVALDGSSNRYDGVMLLADKIGADRFLLPAPVVAASIEEKESLQGQNLVKAVFKVACEADVGMIGIGRRDAQAFPLPSRRYCSAISPSLLRHSFPIPSPFPRDTCVFSCPLLSLCSPLVRSLSSLYLLFVLPSLRRSHDFSGEH